MRKSKSLLFLCFTIVFSMIISLSSCGKSEVEKIVEEANNQCPVPYNLFTAKSFECKDNTVIIDYTIDEDIAVFGNVDDETLFKLWQLFCVDESSPGDKTMIKSITASGCNIECKFRSINSGKVFTISVVNDKLKRYKPLNQEQILRTLVNLIDSHFPKTIDQITKAINLKVDKDNVVYEYEIDESNFDISIMKKDKNYKENGYQIIKNEFLSKTLSGRIFMLAARSGRGICHHFTGKTTGKVVEIKFSNDEVKQIADEAGVS